MSVAVCRSSASGFESILMLNTRNNESNTWLTTTTAPPPLPLFEIENKKEENEDDVVEKQPGQSDIWTSIQSQKAQQEANKPYVHPLMRQSSTLLSQKSLEICTENLGSETGSDNYFSSDDETYLFSYSSSTQKEVDKNELSKRRSNTVRKEVATVNYHCSATKRSSNMQPFPPPLPSISRREGPCLQMRQHRHDGRLVVEAVTVPSKNFLHAERRNGRLLLSFINPTTANHENNEFEEEQEPVVEEVEEEEEVEVVDRGTVVEVKVSTQPQQQSGGPAAMKIHRSSIVINKFVSCNLQLNDQMQSLSNDVNRADNSSNSYPAAKRLPSTATTTAAAAAVAASSASVFSDEEAATATPTTDNKLLFTSKRRNREELLHDVRRCSQLRKPLFIWEPCCIATST